MKKVWFILVLLIIVSSLSAQKRFPQNYFSSPVDFQIYLSSNFGEIRTDHYHSGIDIKTKGRSGEVIRSIANGYISRISVSGGGYGRALYINHPNGYTSVYGHLSKFSEEIEEYLKKEQYRKESFAVNLYPDKEVFRVKKKDIIGYSGNSGSSLGAHLHFEIRETDRQAPTNVMLYGFDIKDDVAPTILTVILYPMDADSRVLGGHNRVEFPVNGSGGKYELSGSKAVNLSGKIGLAVESWDKLTGVSNKCGVYSIELLENNELISHTEMDEFLFSESRYINSNIDYRERMSSGKKIRKCFKQPNDRLRLYKSMKGDGSFTIRPGEMKKIELVIKDVYGNTSKLNFLAEGDVPQGSGPRVKTQDYLMKMPWQQANSYHFNGFGIDIPANALYDSLDFKLVVTPPGKGMYSWIYHVHDVYTPVHKAFSLMIKPEEYPAGMEDKLLIGSLNKKGEIVAAGGEYKEGYIELKTKAFGNYFVCLDSLPPIIRPNNFIPSRGKDLSRLDRMEFIIKDDLSGISETKGLIDGKWALFEFDPKRNKLFYYFDKERIGSGKDHSLELSVTDSKGNRQEFNFEFTW